VLTGATVVVTRAKAQASGLVQRLSDLGASVVELPVIAIEGPADGGVALAGAADRLVAGDYDWVVVTSANGVDRLMDAIGGRAVPGPTRWAAVGASTARALTGRGVTADLVPGTAVSDALVDAFPSYPPAAPAAPPGSDPLPDDGGGAVLYARAERARDVVGPGLGAKGWRVDEVVAYRTVAGEVDPAAVEAARTADAVAFTSSSTVERTLDLLGASDLPPVIASIGPVTSASVRAAGLTVSVEAAEHTLDGLVTAVATALSHEGRPATPGPAASGPARGPAEGPAPSA
jgi:uroporphyrinogen-III synthase